MTTDEVSQEDKFLEIVGQDDLPQPAGNSIAEIEEAFPDIDEDTKERLRKIVDQGMMTPQDIIQSAKINQHNAEVQAKRDADLARRRARRRK